MAREARACSTAIAELLALVGAMSLAKRIVDLGRAARATHDLKNRQPLASATLVLSPEVFGVDGRPQLEQVRELV